MVKWRKILLFINWEKISLFLDLALILLVFYFSVEYIKQLQNKNIELEMKAFYFEVILLDKARIYEKYRSLTYLDLLECQGMNKNKVDSLRFMVGKANKIMITRDSVYLVYKFNQLKHNVNK